MKAFMAKFKKHIVGLLIVIVVFIAFCLYTVKQDYVTSYPWDYQSSDNVIITQDSPAEFEIISRYSNLRFLDFKIELPDKIQDTDKTNICVFDGDRLLDSFEIWHGLPTLDSGTIRFALNEAADYQKDHSYKITIISTAVNEDTGLSFSLSSDNEKIWCQMYYRWLSCSMVRIAVITLGIIVIILFYSFLAINDFNVKPENIFMILSIIMCIAYTFGMPGFRVPDEEQHFSRTYGILHGYFIVPASGTIPISSVFNMDWHGYTPFIMSHFWNSSEFIATDTLREWPAVNMALYSPMSYILQSLGMGFGLLIANHIAIWYWAGRLVQAIGCTALIYYAIKIIPNGKWTLAVISLFPVAIQERASLSADGTTYAAVVTLVAYCIFLRYNTEALKKNDYIILYALVILVASCKLVYFVTALIVMAIPASKYGSKLVAWIHRGILALITLGISIGWFAIAYSYLDKTYGGGNASEKIVYALSHPFHYILLLNDTFWDGVSRWIYEAVGMNMAYPERYSMNSGIILGIVVLTLFIWWKESKNIENRDNLLAVIAFGILVLGVTLILSSLYTQWTQGNPEDITLILGLHGRYFLPFIPVVLCSLIMGDKADYTIPKPEFLVYENIGMLYLLAFDVISVIYVILSSSFA